MLAARVESTSPKRRDSMPTLLKFVDGPYAGSYLLSYDPDHAAGRGLVQATSDPQRAQQFPSIIEAFREWKRPSSVQPLRRDGKPNRPMTAWSVTHEEYP